jgi:hypothetical protein
LRDAGDSRTTCRAEQFGSALDMELPMKKVDVGEMPAVISDSGRVLRDRPTDISDSGAVRIGNFAPAFPMMPPLVRGRPITISDTGEVQIGEYGVASSSGSRADGPPNVRIAAVGSPVRRK